MGKIFFASVGKTCHSLHIYPGHSQMLKGIT